MSAPGDAANGQTAKSPRSAQEEAAELLSQVARDLVLPEPDLKSALTRCQFASHLMGWTDWRDWFQREIGGVYPETVPIPAHRRIVGVLTWRRKVEGARRQVERDLERSMFGPRTRKEGQEKSITYDLRFGFDVVKELANSSQIFEDLRTGKRATDWDERQKRDVQLEQVQRFTPSTFRAVLEGLRQTVVEFAIYRYTYARWGAAITDVMLEYKRAIDARLPSMGLQHHVDAIESNLRSDNPALWRTAVYACRNLLQDLGRDLWRVPGAKYAGIKNHANKPIDVTEDKFANRIAAYLHQKAFGESARRLVVAEAEAIATIVAALPQKQGQAHAPMTLEEARSVAVATYLVVGELVMKTDMLPVTELFGSK